MSAAFCRYADYLYGVVLRNTELLAAARPSSAGSASTSPAAKSPPANSAAGKASAGKASKRAAQDADARHMREFAEVFHAAQTFIGLDANDRDHLMLG